jgi:hypothetical protein
MFGRRRFVNHVAFFISITKKKNIIDNIHQNHPVNFGFIGGEYPVLVFW